MGEQLALVGAPSTLDVLDRHAPESAWLSRFLDQCERAARAAAERVRRPRSRSAEQGYRAAWRRWGRYCSALSLEPLPVDPRALVAFLELLSGSLSPATVRYQLAAIASLDLSHRRLAGERRALSIRQHVIVQRWLQSWSRDHPKAPRRQAAIVRPDQLDAILQRASEPTRNTSAAAHCAMYARDRAIFTLGTCAALRVAELVQLDVGDVVQTERGLDVHVRRSKTDQGGEGVIVSVLPQSRLSRCPIEAWQQWLRVRGDSPGPAWLAVERSGQLADRLTVRQVQAMITRRAEAAGLDGVSAHSLRRTFATLATEHGADLPKVMAHGRWTTAQTAIRYVDTARRWDRNPTSGLLD